MNNKMLATVKSIDTKDGGPGEFEAVLSAPTVDRDGEVIDAGAFLPLPKRINIDLDHDSRVEKTVGSGVPFYDEFGILRIKGTFASTTLAQDVRTLVTEGHIDSLSVKYMNALYEIDKDDGRPHLRKAELLNAGIVGIPSNRDALITMSKNYAASAAELAEAAASTKSSEASDETTDTEEKAATAADIKSPAVPAGPQVDVATMTARARMAVLVAAARSI